MTIANPSGKFLPVIIIFLILRVMTEDAWAGPPFATDDPFALPYYTGELYLFSAGSVAKDGTAFDAAPGVEANFSFFRNTFLHVIFPLSLNHPKGSKSAYGPGDMELGFKWRLIKQFRYRPQIGIFPILVLPTGDAKRGLGSQKAQLFLPLWLGKETDTWTWYGGGGYWINPGDGNRNWWFTGLLVQRQISDGVFIGAEIYHQTPDETDGSPGTGFDFGGGIEIAGPYQILFSGGRDLQNPDRNEFSFYLALYRTF